VEEEVWGKHLRLIMIEKGGEWLVFACVYRLVFV